MPIERIVAATDFSAASARALRSWLAGAEVQASVAAIEARLHEAAIDAGVLVVGAHGRSLVGEIALGSTALALLERCAAPLLLVRSDATHAYRKVLAGVAFEPAAREAIRQAAALAPDADFTLAHVYEDPFAAELFLGQASDAAVAHYRERARSRAERELERFCAELGPVGAHTERRLLHGAPGLQLVQLAGQIGAELVLLGSVAANVALMVQTDVLLVRERA